MMGTMMGTLVDPLTFLGSMAWKGGLVLALALGLARVLGRSSAATRQLVLASGLAAIFVLPLTEVSVPWRIGLFTSSAAPHEPVSGEVHAGDREASGDEAAGPDIGTQVASGAAGPVDADPGTILVVVWLAGAALGLTRIGHGLARMQGLVRRGRALDDAAWTEVLDEAAGRARVDRPVRLVESSEVTVPLATGMARATVVVPRAARAWDRDLRLTVLLHELAHVRRRDVLMHVFGRAACALHWFNPLAWLASRRARLECERACDDRVLASGVRASEYASRLLAVAVGAGPARLPAAALPMMAVREIETRIHAILEPTLRRVGPSRTVALVIALAGVTTAVPLAALAVWKTPQAVVGAAPDARDDLAVEVLLDALGADESASIRARAAWSLGEWGDPRAVQGLAAAVQDPDTGVRLAAAWALMEIGDAAGAPALEGAIKDPSAEVRTMAARALGELELDRVPDGLLDAVRDPDPGVRQMAVWAVGELR